MEQSPRVRHPGTNGVMPLQRPSAGLYALVRDDKRRVAARERGQQLPMPRPTVLCTSTVYYVLRIHSTERHGTLALLLRASPAIVPLVLWMRRRLATSLRPHPGHTRPWSDGLQADKAWLKSIDLAVPAGIKRVDPWPLLGPSALPQLWVHAEIAAS